MKKTFIYSISLLFLLAVGNSCKKEKMTFNPELCGTWELRVLNYTYFKSGKLNFFYTNYSGYNYDTERYGKLILTIKPSGKFVFSNKNGTERFQLAKQENFNIEIYKGGPNAIKDLAYNLHLRNWKGEVFQFKLSYDVETNTLVTVPWYKGTVFYKKEAPFSGEFSMDVLGVKFPIIYYTGKGVPHYAEEMLGIFKKIQ